MPEKTKYPVQEYTEWLLSRSSLPISPVFLNLNYVNPAHLRICQNLVADSGQKSESF